MTWNHAPQVKGQTGRQVSLDVVPIDWRPHRKKDFTCRPVPTRVQRAGTSQKLTMFSANRLLIFLAILYGVFLHTGKSLIFVFSSSNCHQTGICEMFSWVIFSCGRDFDFRIFFITLKSNRYSWNIAFLWKQTTTEIHWMKSSNLNTLRFITFRHIIFSHALTPK